MIVNQIIESVGEFAIPLEYEPHLKLKVPHHQLTVVGLLKRIGLIKSITETVDDSWNWEIQLAVPVIDRVEIIMVILTNSLDKSNPSLDEYYEQVHILPKDK